MKKKEIPIVAIERNNAWIKAAVDSLGKRNDATLLRETMRDTGKKCADQLLEKAVDHFGRTPETVDELIEAVNKRRRDILNASTFLVRDGNNVHFELKNCSCDLVESGLAEPNPNFCLCSAGMLENLFVPFCKGPVETEILKAIGMGDDACKFIIHLDGNEFSTNEQGP